MFARLALESDRAALAEMGRAHIAEIKPEIEYDETRAFAYFDKYLRDGNPVFWVAQRESELVGYVVGAVADNSCGTGFFTMLDLIYVKPGTRGTRAAALLMDCYDQWVERLNPTEDIICMTNPRIAKSTARFVEKRGFKPVGTCYSRARTA